ncbi:MAG: FHA domain-containing protein [Fimbriimonadaceae bacterium]|nr:FHA domain-containing protein [Fimbriimonadaceae bacterium]
MGRAIGRALVCFLAGGLWWLFVEPQFPKNINAGLAFAADPAWNRAEALLTIGLCALIGVAGGALQGLTRGSRTQMIQSTVAGLGFGLAAGFLGRIVMGMVFDALMMGQAASIGGQNPTSVVRALTFLPLGMFLGAAVGGTQFSVRGVSAGAVGGMIGAIVTGILFDPISAILAVPMLATTDPGTVQEIGGPGRAFLCAGLGFFVGLFTAIADVLSRKAWVRLVLGRNEGREWAIDHSATYIGRDERAGIPLFGDPDVAPHHATITRHGGMYTITDAGSPVGIGHNGIRVANCVLHHGDSIQIGRHQLQFLLRGAGAARPPVTPMPQNQPMQSGQPMMQGQPTPHVPTQTGLNIPQGATIATTSAQLMGAPATLVALSGPLTGQRFTVNTLTVIGREGDIALADAQASRKHCSVSPSPGGVQLTDLGSTNGTLVGGARITQTFVGNGQTFQIGQTQFRVEA